jgi:hypothetical protein
MNIISSQRHIDTDVVEEKKHQLEQHGEVELRIAQVGTDTKGEAVYVLLDGHHTLAAAREMGIEDFTYEVVRPTDAGFAEDDDMQTALEKLYMDSDYYWITGENAGWDITGEEWEIIGA